MLLENSKEFERECRFDQQRRKPAEYCEVLIFNGYFDEIFDNGKKWYWLLEGDTILCQIRRNRFNRIVDFVPVRLTNTSVFLGRTIDPSDCIII